MNTVLMILPELGYGGAEKSFCALSVELSQNYTVKIVVFNQGYVPTYPIGGDIISLENKAAKSWLTKIVNLLMRIKKLRKIKFNLKPYASISFLEGANYVNILSAGDEKTIISVRGSIEFDQNINNSFAFIRKKFLTPILYSRADSIVALSHGIKQELVKTYPSLVPENIEVIYNSVDHEKILKLAREPLSKEWENYFAKNTVLIMVSRLAEEKGVHLFVQIFSQLISRVSNLKLLIIGDGPYLSVIQNRCNELNTSYNKLPSNIPSDFSVHFLGYEDNPFNMITKSTIFISSSLHEGLGNSILEAMACGVPVISSDCPYGPREILTDKTYHDSIEYPFVADGGILLPEISGNTKLWTNVISEKLDNNLEIIKKVNFSSRLKHFDKKYLKGLWLDLLEPNHP